MVLLDFMKQILARFIIQRIVHSAQMTSGASLGDITAPKKSCKPEQLPEANLLTKQNNGS